MVMLKVLVHRCLLCMDYKLGLAEVGPLLMDRFWHVRAAEGIGVVSEFSPQATGNHSVARAGGYALSGFESLRFMRWCERTVTEVVLLL